MEDYPIDEKTRQSPELACSPDVVPDVIDDIFICPNVTYIDGVLGILGTAGPNLARFGDTITTVVGFMDFDLADVENLVADGKFDGVIVSCSVMLCSFSLPAAYAS